MRLIDADAVKKALRNRISENIDECINNVPTVDVLDKIRAEIEQIEINGYIRDVECFSAGINAALNVIDKYKAESEAV